MVQFSLIWHTAQIPSLRCYHSLKKRAPVNWFDAPLTVTTRRKPAGRQGMWPSLAKMIRAGGKDAVMGFGAINGMSDPRKRVLESVLDRSVKEDVYVFA
jgi:hypothetical protein